MRYPVCVSESDYEYRGMMAAAWDLLRGDVSGWSDRAFYRDTIAKYGEPALDVGCGTGRLVLDYVASGIDCDGVDNSPEMLELARAKAQTLGVTPNLYEQQMQSLHLPRRYRTIFVPSSSFLLLPDEADAAAAMRGFYEHLLPGGVLVMPFMYLWPGTRTPEDNVMSKWVVTGQRTRPDDGALIRRWTRARWEMSTQLEHTQDRYEVIVGDETVTTEEHGRSPSARWYSYEQSLAVYRAAGFSDVHAVREFTFEPAGEDEHVWTVFGTRSEPK